MKKNVPNLAIKKLPFLSCSWNYYKAIPNAIEVPSTLILFQPFRRVNGVRLGERPFGLFFFHN